MATPRKKKSGTGSGSQCLDGKPQVNGQPPDLRSKLMAAYMAMEYGGGTKTPNENNTPVYPSKSKNKAK
jgi:hypothetical protein